MSLSLDMAMSLHNMIKCSIIVWLHSVAYRFETKMYMKTTDFIYYMDQYSHFFHPLIMLQYSLLSKMKLWNEIYSQRKGVYMPIPAGY